MAIIGAALFVGGAHDFLFLRSADAEAIDICVGTPSMDCDPRHWLKTLVIGGALLFASFVIVVAQSRWTRRD